MTSKPETPREKVARKDEKSVRFKGSAAKPPVGTGNALAPNWLFYAAFVVSFTLPNLVFSGRSWYDTLHLWKWAVTMVPIAVVAAVVGFNLLRRGPERTKFVLDPFGTVWLLLLLLVTIQPLILRLSSVSTFAKEWFYFACLFAVYVLSYNLCKDGRLHRVLLWGANVNAAINVLFAEMLIRNLNGPFPFILGVPGNYIGNTAQQEMFGLWTAMAVLNAIFLHLYYVGEGEEERPFWKRPLVLLNLFLLAANSWGLWSSTTRGAILSLAIAFFFLILSLWRTGEIKSLKRSFKLFAVVVVFLALVLGVSSMIGTGRGNALVSKMMDMIHNPTAVGNRISIWRTSWEVYLKSPVTGVGLGQYKWHFLDGQRVMFEKQPELLDNPQYDWQYTYWAHSEYIQWLCEMGLIGTLILLGMALWWLFAFLKALITRKHLPPAALWGCAMLFMLWFDALFSRPFHRIENSVWMSLAFALANRALLPSCAEWMWRRADFLLRGLGALMLVVSLYGIVFLAGGMMGDKHIYRTIVRQGSVQDKMASLQAAASHLMSRDDALEELGRLYIGVGTHQKDARIYAEGVRILYEAYLRRPTAKLLFDLINYARVVGDRGLFDSLKIYFKPGMLVTTSDENAASER